MAEGRYWLAQDACVSDETKARAFNSKVINVNLRGTVRGINGKGMGGLFYPGDADSKTGQPVMGVMR